jgi:capsular polysaccharide biosynthesis protein
MILNTPMIRRQWLRLLAGKWISMEDLAIRTWTICPAETPTLPPAIHPDGALEKIRGISPWRRREQEQLMVSGGPYQYIASTARLIPNVDIVDSYFYAGPAAAQIGYQPERLLRPTNAPHHHLKQANLVTTWGTSHFFGPLLLDDFLLELNGDNPAENIRMITKPYGHEQQYRAMLGLTESTLQLNAHVDRLITYEEPANNSHKAQGYRTLRARMRQHLGVHAARNLPGVYLKRGTTGESRILTNEAEVEKLMLQLGFDIVEPAKLGAEEIARRTLDARIVVSVEGSHLSHTLFSMANNAAFLVIQPPDRFAMVYKEFTDCLDMRFAFIVADPAEGGFTANLSELQDTLDRLAALQSATTA